MIQKKLCMLGSFAVGKTSLVARFVTQMFSDRYLTTVGVRIDKKELTVGEQPVKLMLWDLHGEDEFQRLQLSYLRGSSAYILVVDGTRRQTLDEADGLYQRVREHLGALPFVLALNKADLSDRWEIDRAAVAEVWQPRGAMLVETSAKTGVGVEEMFLRLSEAMLGRS